MWKKDPNFLAKLEGSVAQPGRQPRTVAEINALNQQPNNAPTDEVHPPCGNSQKVQTLTLPQPQSGRQSYPQWAGANLPQNTTFGDYYKRISGYPSKPAQQHPTGNITLTTSGYQRPTHIHQQINHTAPIVAPPEEQTPLLSRRVIAGENLVNNSQQQPNQYQPHRYKGKPKNPLSPEYIPSPYPWGNIQESERPQPQKRGCCTLL